jgi:hypothetical protein
MSRATVASRFYVKQEANQSTDGNSAATASRDAQQLLQAVQCDENFTMQVHPRRSAPLSPSIVTLLCSAQSNLRSWTLELEALAAAAQ